MQLSKSYEEGQDFVILSLISWNPPVMDGMFVSPQNSYVEMLTLSVMAGLLKDGSFMKVEPS